MRRRLLPLPMMKIKFALCALVLAGAHSLSAAPLPATAAVYLQPNDTAAVLSYLKAGTEPVRAGTAPDGWIAIELPGEHVGYVQNKDISKGLDVREGTAVHTAPEITAPVLTHIEAGDHADLTGLHGKWTQIRFDKKLVGYVRVNGVPTAAAPAPAVTPAPAPASTPLAPAPVAATAYGASQGGAPAPVVSLNDGGPAALPRFFQGRFESTRRPFMPRRPYDWQLKDDAGVRYAYLDISKLLLTEQIEKYIDHVVVVYGTAKPTPGGKDIVIEVESLQLK